MSIHLSEFVTERSEPAKQNQNLIEKNQTTMMLNVHTNLGKNFTECKMCTVSLFKV